VKEGRIFLIGSEEDRLIPMIETGYATEDILQVLLARYPDLLAGDQINPEAPRRWLLVAREMGVPGAESGSDRWSLDHLFLDQDGVPTFVECKRATDTRGRREVVAQMLDYAANGVEYWGMDRLRQAAAETAEAFGKSLDDEIELLLGGTDETDIEAYWSLVETNLNQGRVRLIFVADETPVELRRLVEFLNEKMQDVEVLALEVKQYLGHGQKALVSRVLGATEAARRLKSGVARKQLTWAEFMSQLPPGLVTLFEQILEKSTQRGHVIRWRKSAFAVRVRLDSESRPRTFFYGMPDGSVQFYFGYLPIDDEEMEALRSRLRSFRLSMQESDKAITARPDASAISRVLEMYDFVLDKVDDIARRY
jgi:hypothetical protein